MNCKGITNYGGGCCAEIPAKGHTVTGIIGAGNYTRLVDGRFLSGSGIDLTSGYKGKALLKPNGSRSASQIVNVGEASLCGGCK